jgi:hypothetical protein
MVAVKGLDGHPAKDAEGNIVRVQPSYVTYQGGISDNLIWTPAQGDLNGAIEQFRKLLELQPNNIVARRNLEAALSKKNLPQ